MRPVHKTTLVFDKTNFKSPRKYFFILQTLKQLNIK